jgi:beta-barrel assembly-enhancing protease
MKKVIIQAAISITIFFTAWYSLTQINWLKIFAVQQTKDATEEKLGNLFWESFKQNNTENTTPEVFNPIDSIVTQIAAANDVERSSIKLHILNNPQVNAFALPGGHLVVYSGLINKTANQNEFVGVLCHEIAHIQKKHVMQKLVTEVGLAALLAITAGKAGGEATKQLLKTLTGAAFDRSLEKEADITAVDYMVSSKIDAAPFANFLYKLSLTEPEMVNNLGWLNTHPASAERAEYITNYSKGKVTKPTQLLNASTWRILKEATATQ